MCRLLAYCSRSGMSLAEVIGPAGLRDFTAMSAYHSDGWGAALYDAGNLLVEKSARRADEDQRYYQVARSQLADAGLLHLRWATPGLPVDAANSHPFRLGNVTMAHNGAIYPQGRLAEMVPSAWERRLTGSTDSERYFYSVISRMGQDRGDMVAAIAAATADIGHRYQPTSLNAVFLTPRKLYAVCWYDPANIPVAAMCRRGYTGPPESLAGYFHLAYRTLTDAVVVASSGWPQDGWTTLPNGSVLVVDRASMQPRVEQLPSCPGPIPAGNGSNAGEP